MKYTNEYREYRAQSRLNIYDVDKEKLLRMCKAHGLTYIDENGDVKGVKLSDTTAKINVGLKWRTTAPVDDRASMYNTVFNNTVKYIKNKLVRMEDDIDKLIEKFEGDDDLVERQPDKISTDEIKNIGRLMNIERVLSSFIYMRDTDQDEIMGDLFSIRKKTGGWLNEVVVSRELVDTAVDFIKGNEKNQSASIVINDICYAGYLNRNSARNVEISSGLRLMEEQIKSMVLSRKYDALANIIAAVYMFVEEFLYQYTTLVNKISDDYDESMNFEERLLSNAAENMLEKKETMWDGKGSDVVAMSVMYGAMRAYIWMIKFFGAKERVYMLGITKDSNVNDAMGSVLGDKVWANVSKKLRDIVNGRKVEDDLSDLIGEMKISNAASYASVSQRIDVMEGLRSIGTVVKKLKEDAEEKSKRAEEQRIRSSEAKKELKACKKTVRDLEKEIIREKSSRKDMSEYVAQIDKLKRELIAESNNAKQETNRTEKAKSRIASLEQQIEDMQLESEALKREHEEIKIHASELERSLNMLEIEDADDNNDYLGEVKDLKIMFVGGTKKWGESVEQAFVNSVVYDCEDAENFREPTQLDCVVIYTGIISHRISRRARNVAEKLDVPVVYAPGSNLKKLGKVIHKSVMQ